MTKAVFRKQGMSLLPVDDESREILAKVKEGRDIVLDIKQSRSPRHHRLFFAICKFVKLHSDIMADASIEQIKTSLKLATGFVDTFVDRRTGQTAYVPRSIAFEAMDQTEFNQFFDVAVNIIVNRWMAPGTTSEEVRREIIEMCDGPHAVARAP